MSEIAGTRGATMSGMRWEPDFQTALGKAKATGAPVFQDFWYDG
jgi:hypothetical protein